MPLGTRWGVELFTASNWDGLTPKDPINVAITGSFEDAGSALRFLREEVGWGSCWGSDQFVCQVRPTKAHRNDDQLASGAITFYPLVDRDHVRVYLTDETTPTGKRVLVAPVHHDRWIGLKAWTWTRSGVPVPAWEVADSFDHSRKPVEDAAMRRGYQSDWTWIGNRLAVRQANDRYVAGDGWVLVVSTP